TNHDSDLARLERDLRSLNKHAKAALAADSLSVCSSAALVQSGADSLESGVTALERNHSRADTGTAAVSDAIGKLVDDYETLRSDDPRYLPEDAPTQAAVSRAIRSARRKIRKLGPSNNDALNDARAMLREAKRLETRASAACRIGGS
ncbi:MAG: hypothetical protein M3401_07175, partial [Actinomycetota bacterium]|nr:hypothetical protein [Actinomycetota bacterium]